MKLVRKSGLAVFFLATALWSAQAAAQGCAMCRANAKATPKEGQRAINGAILVMLVPPIGMVTFGAGFMVRYVRQRDRANSEDE